MENNTAYLTLLTTLDALHEIGKPEVAQKLIKELISDYNAVCACPQRC